MMMIITIMIIIIIMMMMMIIMMMIIITIMIIIIIIMMMTMMIMMMIIILIIVILMMIIMMMMIIATALGLISNDDFINSINVDVQYIVNSPEVPQVVCFQLTFILLETNRLFLSLSVHLYRCKTCRCQKVVRTSVVTLFLPSCNNLFI